MANITLKAYVSGAWQIAYPKTIISRVDGLQTALDAKLSVSQKDAANGLCPLDSSRKVPMSNLPDIVIDGMTRIGSITIATATIDMNSLKTANPDLVRATLTKGDFWSIVYATAGSTITITGDADDKFLNHETGAYDLTTISVNAGDWLIYDGYASSIHRWSIQENNLSNVYSPLGHSHVIDNLPFSDPSNSSRVVVSTTSGYVVESIVTGTELEYLEGVSGAIQPQINGKSPTSHAAASTTYGAGTTTNYGHVKLQNDLTASSYVDGVALSAYQGKVISDALALKAPLASPALTGTPTAPTAAAGTDTTQIATTAFVNDATVAKAIKLNTARSISLAGKILATGVNFDGSQNISLTTTINFDGSDVLLGGTAGTYVDNASPIASGVHALDAEMSARAEIQYGATWTGTPRNGDIWFELA